MKIISVCLYCNHQESVYVYDPSAASGRKCEHCGSTKNKLIDGTTTDVFGYGEQKPKKDGYNDFE